MGIADYAPIYQEAALQNNIDPNWLMAQGQVESSGDPDAYNKETGASGLAQLIPATAKSLGVTDPFDPKQAIFAQAKLARQNLDRYGDMQTATSAYHGGTNQENWGPKTQDYTNKVMNIYKGKTQMAQNDTPLAAALKNFKDNNDQEPNTSASSSSNADTALAAALKNYKDEEPSTVKSVKDQPSPFFDALSDIEKDTEESLRNTATNTGQAISEPMNSNRMADWSQHPVMGPLDAGVRTIGKLGNALSGTSAAVFSPIQGALTASVENSGVIPAVANAIKNNLVPDDPRFTANISTENQHQLADNIGGDLTNAIGIRLAGAHGENALRARQGLSPLPKPSNPLTDFMQDESSGGKSSSAIATVPTDQLRSMAVDSYNSATSKGGLLNNGVVDSTIDKAVSNAGYQTPEGRAFAGDNLATQTLDKLESLRGKPLSLQGLQEIDDSIGDNIQSSYRSGNDDVAMKLIKIRDTFRDASKNASSDDMQNPNGFSDWQTGDKLWSTYRASKSIDDILSNAMSADVPSTAIKNGFKAFVKNEKNLAPFNDEEIAALKQAAKTGLVTGALKTFGSKIISGIVGGTAGAAGGGVLGGLAGAGVGEAVGYPFRSAATALQANKANYVKNLLSQRPEVQSALSPRPVMNTPKPAPIPILRLPAPETTYIGTPEGQLIPLTKYDREIIGQSASTISQHIPAERLASNDIVARGVNKTMNKLGPKRVSDYINKLQEP